MPPSITQNSSMHRVEVTTRQGHADPAAAGLVHNAAALGITLAGARATHVYLIAATLTGDQLALVSTKLLADPVVEIATIGASRVEHNSQLVEVHPLPGVMDPVAQSVQLAIQELVGVAADVSTGWRYDLQGLSSSDADTLASRLLANPVIQKTHRAPWHPAAFPVGRAHDQQLRDIPLIKLSNDQLVRLSRDAHLFLSLDEMQAVQAHYKQLGREPRDIELETLAQTWSEHCVHKTLKSTVVYRTRGEGSHEAGAGEGSHEATKGQSHEGGMGSHEATKGRSHEGGMGSHEATKGQSHEGKDKVSPTFTSSPSSPSSLRGFDPPSLSASSSLRGFDPSSLLSLLAHPNIASKHWIIRQYDHEVRGGTIIKPLIGPAGRGPSDASVVQPVPGSSRGLAVSQGLQTGMGDPQQNGDPYLMTIAAIDECVRNLVCVGADPSRIAILDNFCWPSCNKPENMGSLVRAAEGCYDAAKAYRTPFVSGKDSLNNQFTIPASPQNPARTIEIPPTLLITGIGIVPDVNRCVTSDAKRPGSALVLVGPADQLSLGGSHFSRMFEAPPETRALPRLDLTLGPATARAVASLIASGLVLSAHDISDGGLLVALAEMLIGGSTNASPIGACLGAFPADRSALAHAFSEAPSRYLLEIPADSLDRCRAMLGNIPSSIIGHLTNTGRLVGPDQLDVPVEDLAQAWLAPLDW
ncbi:MAG: phosphoribosylformylglycinamidine synthase subunit PurS [Pyrinomonadaceae bacterium]|nr:phosphoribosylformylglycinamidine synthase subunit PurS [Phycisphaerales bacterium]